MLFQLLLTFTSVQSARGELIEPWLVLPALVLIWCGPAFKYGVAALAVFSLGALVFLKINGNSPEDYIRNEVILVVGLPLLIVSSVSAFCHDSVLRRGGDHAYLVNAVCWFGWSAGAAYPLWFLFSQQSYFVPDRELAFVGGVCLFAFPITVFYGARALWSAKPQLTIDLCNLPKRSADPS